MIKMYNIAENSGGAEGKSVSTDTFEYNLKRPMSQSVVSKGKNVRMSRALFLNAAIVANHEPIDTTEPPFVIVVSQ